MTRIVECVANYSEGRRHEIIDQIAAAICEVAGVSLLDRESDCDHNRTVLTFVGGPEAVSEAAYRSIARASELIDLDIHTGQHPRIGATDVVPFVPISGVTMDDCVMLAKALGERVGRELGIPVYLYEAAATRPDRENLANIRKGEYEELKTAIETDPDRLPDYGPARLGKAGATVIGARMPLIAFNVYLTTTDVEIARKIAKAIRHSTGGLRFVKALGLLVNGKAQVSMNLTNFEKTPVYRVVEMIRREAARYGVGIESSELIGLIPQKALDDVAEWYLQIDNFAPSLVLETEIASTEAGASGPSTRDYLDALASGEATPGGGSAATYAGAMGASLVAMVARLTAGKKKYADVADRMREIVTEADGLRLALLEAGPRDEAAFIDVMAAYALPKESEEDQKARAQAIEIAMHHAALVPLETARMATRVLALATEVAGNGNVNAISDAGSASQMAMASFNAAAMNVRINALSVTDKAAAEGWLNELAALEAAATESLAKVRASASERGGI